jgi:hypothetical protein
MSKKGLWTVLEVFISGCDTIGSYSQPETVGYGISEMNLFQDAIGVNCIRSGRL